MAGAGCSQSAQQTEASDTAAAETKAETTGEDTSADTTSAEEANPVADVVILASWSDGLSMKNDGKIMSYAPANSDKVVSGFSRKIKRGYRLSSTALSLPYVQRPYALCLER